MTLLNKFKNEQNRQLQIQAQLAEQSYRAFNGVKQSRENERSGELRKKMNDDLPASSLTKTMMAVVTIFKSVKLKNFIMADDIVDTIAQYDLDEDFPPYANDQNKELNQIVREKVRLVAQLGLEIEEH